MSLIDFGGGPARGDLSVRWIHGSRSPRHRTDPPIQVHRYDAHTVIMRQSKDLSFEAPFLYLFFGNARALLLDTGATSDPAHFPLRATVDRLVAEWLGEHPRGSYELVVAHTHGHNDHTAGDAQFSERADTIVVPKAVEAVRAFFGIAEWPSGAGRLDLGGRVLEVLPTPGHDPREVSVYDPWTQFLITGDVVYPGRLYAFDFPAFLGSLNRLASFAEKTPVSHVMGCHIEMTRTPKRDYPAGAKYQPDEPPLEMTVDQLHSVRGAAESVAKTLGAHYFDDYAIFHGPCYGALMKQVLRGLGYNFKRTLGAV
jgi:hydroxyacylglutathione hydrolase